jgi:hypothetical protein
MNTKTETFEGTIVRIEPNGFGVIKFDNPISTGNTHGILSSTVTSTNNYLSLPVGAHVTGQVQLESDPEKFAPITSITLFPRSA